MSYAKENNLPHLSNCLVWFPAVRQVFKKIPEATAYFQFFKHTYRSKIENNELPPEYLQRDFEECARDWPTSTGNRATERGEFIALGGEVALPLPTSNLSKDKTDPAPREVLRGRGRGRGDRGRGRGGRGRGSRGRGGSRANPLLVDKNCSACGAVGHRIDDCYYAFPELRPKGYPINTARKRIVELMLQEDDIRKEVERVKRKQVRTIEEAED